MVNPEDVILKELDKIMNDFADRILQLSQERLIDDGKIDTGNLLKTANINRKFLEKEVIYPAPYADSVEFGRHPGTMPSTDRLEGWVRSKLGIKNKKEARRVAFNIARAIKRRGIMPSPYLEPAIAQARAEFKL